MRLLKMSIATAALAMILCAGCTDDKPSKPSQSLTPTPAGGGGSGPTGVGPLSGDSVTIPADATPAVDAKPAEAEPKGDSAAPPAEGDKKPDAGETKDEGAEKTTEKPE